MLNFRRTVPAAAFALLSFAAAGSPALAQEGNTVGVGPPQLRDFQLPGERRTPPPRPQQIEPAPTPPAAQRSPAQEPARPRAEPPRERPAAETRRAPPQREPERTLPTQPQEVFQLPQAPAEGAAPVPAPVPPTQPEPLAGAPAPAEPWPFWYYLLPAALAALGGALLLRRRRRAAVIAAAAEEAAAAPPPPRPAPVPRPWLEVEVKAERAASTDSEAWVEFELVLHNTGKSPARNIRLNARMLNAGREQDKEIGAFFRTKGEGRKTHTIGDLPPGERGLVQGSVSMPREEMRALQVNEQLLFIPVLAVNVLYDWGEGRTGQTSKSYVVGRELGERSQKMGAFRLDLGPRIYRTVGQRQHNLAKRV
jgi:MYXO-CTERM domain-containing protein